MRAFAVAITIAVVGGACGRESEPVPQSDVDPGFVGRAVCAECHTTEADAWRGSHHDLAMQVADEGSVLGDFGDATFDYFGTVTRFLKRNGQYIVQTPGEGTEPVQFPVKYTFGVEPLQQYLVEFPDGRLQTLPFCWDTRSGGDGGQRWFHVYPDEMITPHDPLYWTGREQNWNYMCAECHSTHVELGYDAVADSFATTWKEIDVSCEACHGPGSVHVGQAERADFDATRGLVVDLDDRRGTTWVMNPDTGIAKRSKARVKPPHQPDACGRCHARRSVIAPDYEYGKPLADTHLPALLQEPLYFADGQIREEVYVYGSFLQSRMYRAGVSCSDCHEPHSLELVTGDDPNSVCATCHLPAKFATDEHRRHAPEVANCVNCHMPERIYMAVDGRRDHSFRVPRPDLSESVGTPNACNGCHTDRKPSWAIAAMTEWYGDGAFGRPEFATALSAARMGYANDALRKVLRSVEQPAIARATALTLLDQPMSDEDFAAIRSALANPDPLIRIAAHRALLAVPGDFRSGFSFSGLSDPVRSVRIEAVLAFAPIHDLLPSADARAFREATTDYRAAYEYTANRPESLANMGRLELAMGNIKEALTRYRQALAVEPSSVVARANLADIHRGLGNEAEAERILREGLAIEPGSAALHHSLGLLLVRTARVEEALAELREAARLSPDDPHFAYVLGVALNSLGEDCQALEMLESARQRFPTDFNINWTLATIYRDRGDLFRARAISEELLERHPNMANAVALHRSLLSER